MIFLRVIGALIFVAGIACILISNYITTQVNEGKIKIVEGQEKVDQGKQLFSFSPVTKQIGKKVTSSGQQQINEGKLTIQEYERISTMLKTGGIIGCVLGGGLFFISFLKSRNKRRR